MSTSKKKPKVKAEIADERPGKLPLLPTFELVALPGVVIPLLVSGGPAAEAIRAALESDRVLTLVLQTGAPDVLPNKRNLAGIGTCARIVHAIFLPTGEVKVRLHVESRVRIKSLVSVSPYVTAHVEYIDDEEEVVLSKGQEKAITEIRESMELLGQYDQTIEEHLFASKELYHPGELADLVASALPLGYEEAQAILEELNYGKRLNKARESLSRHVDRIALKERISVKTDREFRKLQREEILREHMRQIRNELGEEHDNEGEIERLKSQLKKAKLPKTVREEADKQVRRLQHMHPDTSEAALMRTYLEWILELPWGERTKDRIDLEHAKKILDEDHYGLEKTKDRILDFLGVRKLKKSHRGPILLLVGPPGVGKTSLGRSIARALGRKFVRVSVGGLRDEAELRGHRRTYVGALPGRVIQGLKTAGSRNPVFMLDEIDKIGADFRGDPASVLLEVLDPEQNKAFEDHYLNLPFDLSEVMFIATANLTDTIPAALRDRLETIDISGYTQQEKTEIAKRYLIPRAKSENGLEKEPTELIDRALELIIRSYTRESGVRELGRMISTVFRKVARSVAEGNKAPECIDQADVKESLGPLKYSDDERPKSDEVGLVTGLAWTSVGGETLMIEVAITRGKGSLSLTGQQGEVMRESAMAALTYVMANAERLHINPKFYESSNVHVHLPQGAIPKDGPSAGISIATALVSALSGKPVSRDVAMTGEITLRGKVLPIGGLKEKALAALRTGIQTVIFPKENEKDLQEFPEYLIDNVTFIPVEHVDDVLNIALVGGLEYGAKKITEDKPTRAEGKLEPIKRPITKKVTIDPMES